MENLYYRTLVVHTVKNDFATEWTLFLEDTLEGYRELTDEITASMHGDGETGKVISLYDLTGSLKFIDALNITDFTLSSNYPKEVMEDMVAEDIGEDFVEFDEDDELYFDAICDCDYCEGYHDPDFDLDYGDETEEEDDGEW